MSALIRYLESAISPEPNTGCWLWTKSVDRDGYGKAWWNKRLYRVHRLAFEAWVGAIPGGVVVDHLCRQRSCLNPGHLELVTAIENTRRGVAARTSCRNGHAMDEANTYRWKNSRVCRACSRATSRKYSERARVAVAA